MTEAEWLHGTNLPTLGEWLEEQGYQRKLRLFVVACCRQAWDLLPGEASRRAVEVAEMFADGLATAEELAAARAAVFPVHVAGKDPRPFRATIAAGFCADEHGLWDSPVKLAEMAADDAARPGATEEAWLAAFQAEIRKKIVFLREFVGNPFRPVTVEEAWLVRNDGAVPKIAQEMYDERAFERMGVLADALEEAGCTDAEVLEHCRGPGPHARGCWLVDLLLGKK